MRKHVEWWRNRDGSYEALVTFKGETAFEQIIRAVRKMPGRPYMQVKYYNKEQLDDDGGTAVQRVKLRDRAVWLRILSTPTFRGETPSGGLDYALSFVFAGHDPRLYRRRIGLSVYWAN